MFEIVEVFLVSATNINENLCFQGVKLEPNQVDEDADEEKHCAKTVVVPIKVNNFKFDQVGQRSEKRKDAINNGYVSFADPVEQLDPNYGTVHRLHESQQEVTIVLSCF